MYQHDVVTRVKPLLLCVVLLLVAGAGPAHGAVITEDFGGLEEGRSAPGFRGSGLEVVIPKGAHWGLGAFQPLPRRADEAWFRYMLMLEDWSPSQSGKLPGFSSLRSSAGRGCTPPSDARPGWSARIMYRPVGASGAPADSSRIGYYAYHLDQPKDCGEIMEWNDAGILAPGNWYCIEGHIRLNEVGAADGALHGWVDGVHAFGRDDLRFRSSPNVGVDDLWLNVFSGGKPRSPERLTLRLDEVVVSTVDRVGCPDAFDDDRGDPNEAAFNRLDDLGLFPACGPYLACPREAMSRAAFVSLLVGAAGVGGGADHPDAFGDDDGHPFEQQIDSAAAVGLTAGCAPGRFCPDEHMTRGAAAVMITRAFSLPPAGGIVFDDVADPAVARASSALASAMVSGGCGGGAFCPDAVLTRSQAAAMIAAAIAQGRVETEPRGRVSRPSIDDVLARQRPRMRQPV